MDNGKHLVYEFRGFQLDPAGQKLFCHGQPVALTPKLFETLIFLVENRDRTLLKDELMQAVWAGTFVEEANLSQNIFLLRKALGDDRNGHSFIHTVPRQGYRFIAPVTEIETESIGPLPGARDWEYWKKHSPFRSLTAFEEEDAWLFFGREAETADLLNRVVQSPVVVVVGNSGSGKSSLLRAGLIPALRERRPAPGNGQNGTHGQEQWQIVVFRPSAAPFDYLAEVLPGQLAPQLSVKEQNEFIAELRDKLPTGGDALRNAISALVFAANNLSQTSFSRVLLVVDQFEELYTLTGKQSVRDRYIDSLLAAARLDGAALVHLVLSLRADFFSHCLDHRTLSTQLETALFTLSAMNPEQMRETIEKRLQLAGGRAEPGLIDSLLEDVGAEPGNLALLEHALGQLWEQCSGPGRTFTNCAYSEMGRLRGALGRHADAVLESLDEEQKQLAQKIFLELVHLGEGAQDTRRRVAKSELLALNQPDPVEELLTRLSSSRLIAMGREGDDTFVEVSHEALIREWPALRAWLAENRDELSLERRLVQAAEEWQNLSRDPGALLQGARLAQAEDWLVGRQDTDDLLCQYVEASIAARSEASRREREVQQRELTLQKQTTQRFRWFSYALVVLFLVSSALAWVGYHLQIVEKSRAMAAQSGELLQKDRGQALDMAIQSWNTSKTEEAHIAVAKAFAQPLAVLQHDNSVLCVVFSPDGHRVLTTSRDRTARIWDADDGRLLVILQGHTDEIRFAAFSPDGQHVATSSADKTARVWNANDGRLLFTLRGHSASLWDVVFSPDGKRIATTSEDHTARLWNAQDGSLLAILQGHRHVVEGVDFSPNGQLIVTASWDRTARVWNAADGSLLRTLQHDSEVIDVGFSPDSQQIAAAAYGGSVRVWNTADGRLLLTLQHGGPAVGVLFSGNGRRLLTTSYDNVARVWNIPDGRLLFTLRHNGGVGGGWFSRDDRRILTSSLDRTARVWSAADGRLLAALEGHTDQLRSTALSRDGLRIASGSADHTARLWNNVAARRMLALHHQSVVGDVAFSADGQRLVTASDDRTARIWNSADGRLLATLSGHEDRVRLAAFSPDNRRVLTAGWDKTPRVWDPSNGKLIAALHGHTGLVLGASFSPDGQRIVTASRDRTARVWSAVDGKLLLTLQGHTAQVQAAAFSPDGQRILTASDDHTARIWNSSDGSLFRILRGHTEALWDATFSPDGKRVVTGSADHTARIWSSGDGHLIASLSGHSDVVYRTRFSPDGKQIVTASWDHTARIWNSSDGSSLFQLRGHTDALYDVRFSRDGQRIVTASEDQTARVWNSANGRLIVVLSGHTGGVWRAVFSPDGQRIVTCSEDSSARIWEILTLDDIERILSK